MDYPGNIYLRFPMPLLSVSFLLAACGSSATTAASSTTKTVTIKAITTAVAIRPNLTKGSGAIPIKTPNTMCHLVGIKSIDPEMPSDPAATSCEGGGLYLREGTLPDRQYVFADKESDLIYDHISPQMIRDRLPALITFEHAAGQDGRAKCLNMASFGVIERPMVVLHAYISSR